MTTPTTQELAVTTPVVTEPPATPAKPPSRRPRTTPAAKTGDPVADKAARAQAADKKASAPKATPAHASAAKTTAKPASAAKPPARRGKAAATPAKPEPARAAPESTVSERAAKQALARAVVQAIETELRTSVPADAWRAVFDIEEAKEIAAHWVHHLPTGKEDGARWWPKGLPRPNRSDWR